MPDTAKFRIASRLALTTVILMFGLIIIGSIVRTTGSGLACPDWPLCQGRLIPPLQFNVLIEWFHRLVALLVSLMLFVTVVWVLAHAPLRARLGGLAGLAIVLLLAQILLGALTVWKLLDPGVVGGHLGVALLLFSTMLTLALAAAQQAESGRSSCGRGPPACSRSSRSPRSWRTGSACSAAWWRRATRASRAATGPPATANGSRRSGDWWVSRWRTAGSPTVSRCC